MEALELDGNNLTLEAAAEVSRQGREVRLAARARPGMVGSRAVVEAALASGRAVYGVNTGLGRLSDRRIEPGQIAQLQVNLLRSHALGVGEPLECEAVRAMMLLRANSLAKGYSGVRPELVERLCAMLNQGVHPVIPRRGSVGASGDLAPLAHMALVLIGEGEAIFQGHRRAGREALQRAGLEPLDLAAKEGLSLLNGTQGMLALGLGAAREAGALLEAADAIATLSVDALRGTRAAFDDRIQSVRGFSGQRQTAAKLWQLLEASTIAASHRDCGRVQDAYSLRCIPQVHGAVRDGLEFCRACLATELNAAVDNPLVFTNEDGAGELISGGNFHGQPLAQAFDFMAIVLANLAGISERRLERMVNPALNEGLPAFLAGTPGLESGLMMAQVTAAALVAECRTLAAPSSVHSITTSGDKEDFVSMGMNAALKLAPMLTNLAQILALEALAALRALEWLLPLRSGAGAEKARAQLLAACQEIEPGFRPRLDERSHAALAGGLAEKIKAGLLEKTL